MAHNAEQNVPILNLQTSYTIQVISRSQIPYVKVLRIKKLHTAFERNVNNLATFISWVFKIIKIVYNQNDVGNRVPFALHV